MRLSPRLLSDDMIGLKQAAIAGVGIVASPGYVCRQEVRSGALRRVLPTWLAGDSTITALIPYRQGLLPSVRVFIDHLAAEFPKWSARVGGSRSVAALNVVRLSCKCSGRLVLTALSRRRGILGTSDVPAWHAGA